MLCVLTHRRLKPGTYEEFRAAWQPNDWWPAFRNGYHLRSADDPDEVISFAFYDATPEEFEAIRDDPRWLEAEDQRLRRHGAVPGLDAARRRLRGGGGVLRRLARPPPADRAARGARSPLPSPGSISTRSTASGSKPAVVS